MAQRSACTNGHRDLCSAQFRAGSISTIRVVSCVFVVSRVGLPLLPAGKRLLQADLIPVHELHGYSELFPHFNEATGELFKIYSSYKYIFKDRRSR